MKITAQWQQGMALTAFAEGQEPVVRMDASAESGGEGLGLNPKQLLLASVCGCTAMDVISILEKMKVSFTRLLISASAEQTDDHPRVFKAIELLYQIDVLPEQLEKVEKAVELSQTKYCGVSTMLKAHCPVTYQIQLL